MDQMQEPASAVTERRPPPEPPGEPLTILFSDLDDGVVRNISIYELTPYLRGCIVTGTAPGMRVEHSIYTGDLVTGVGEHAYFVGRLKAGEYSFQDNIRPSANGVLIVE